MGEMATFAQRAFSNNQYASLPPIRSISTPYIPFLDLTFTTIDGSLPGGKRLICPIVVQIQRDGDEFLVSEPRFSLYASGATVPEAFAEFRRVIADELDELARDEMQLGPRLTRQLHYLRSIIHA